MKTAWKVATFIVWAFVGVIALAVLGAIVIIWMS